MPLDSGTKDDIETHLANGIPEIRMERGEVAGVEAVLATADDDLQTILDSASKRAVTVKPRGLEAFTPGSTLSRFELINAAERTGARWWSRLMR